jgi:hypothetical protein
MIALPWFLYICTAILWAAYAAQQTERGGKALTFIINLLACPIGILWAACFPPDNENPLPEPKHSKDVWDFIPASTSALYDTYKRKLDGDLFCAYIRDRIKRGAITHNQYTLLQDAMFNNLMDRTRKRMEQKIPDPPKNYVLVMQGLRDKWLVPEEHVMGLHDGVWVRGGSHAVPVDAFAISKDAPRELFDRFGALDKFEEKT